jgi:ABC-type Co2+ transport system permease subunit
MSPLAVHIADGVLSGQWIIGGFAGAGLLAAPGLVRVRDDEVPRLALMTAAFFVASSIHVPLPLTPTSVHLLLNGLVGLILGRRAGLAIFVGLFFQWAFLSHGGLSTVGVNTCIIAIPALLTAGLFRVLDRTLVVRRPAGRWALTFVSAFALLAALAVTGQALIEHRLGRSWADIARTVWLLHPAGLAVLIGLSAAAATWERWAEDRPDFALGGLLGVCSVLMTVGLQGTVLKLGMADVSAEPVLIIVLAHLPVAAVEGVILGSVVAFLGQVRPALLGRPPARRDRLPPGDREQFVKPDLPLAESDTHDR